MNEIERQLISILYYIIGGVCFAVGFMMVRGSLKRVKLIQGRSFYIEDWTACIAFGFMFSISIVFGINLSMDFLKIIEIPSISAYLLLIMLAILIFYPIWEIFELAKPGADAVSDYHRWLETRVLDKFKGKSAYLASLCIILLTYVLPIWLMTMIFEVSVYVITFIWCLLFPLFFLNYYAASGQMANILTLSYSSVRHVQGYPSLQSKNTRIIIAFQEIMKYIVWIPFFMSFYSFSQPIYIAVVHGHPDILTPLSAQFSLFTTVVFGIQGFFTRFWLKKSKTRVIDFLFSGYIMIAIAVNMLISFINIDPNLVYSLFEVDVFGEPRLLELGQVLTRDYTVRLPLIVLQSFVTISYGLYIFLHRESDFNADIRLGAVNRAFGKINEKRFTSETRPASIFAFTRNYLILLKSVLIEPEFNRFGVDVNEEVRNKAAQFIYLTCLEEPDKVKDITAYLINNTIYRKRDKKYLFTSKEAFYCIAKIGETYPDQVLPYLYDALKQPDAIIRRYALQSIGKIGRTLPSIKSIFENIKSVFLSRSYIVKNAAISAIAEMSNNQHDFEVITNYLYDFIRENEHEADLIEMVLYTLIRISKYHPYSIRMKRLAHLLKYSNPNAPEVAKNFIIMYTLKLFSYIVYFSSENFPYEDTIQLTHHSHDYIRYYASLALGNYIINTPLNRQKDYQFILAQLLEMSIMDTDEDVRSICVELIQEFHHFTKINGISCSGIELTFIDYYFQKIKSQNIDHAIAASKGVKAMIPFCRANILPILENQINRTEPELVSNCIHALGLLPESELRNFDLQKLYNILDKNPSVIVKGELINALGNIGKFNDQVEIPRIASYMKHKDPILRMSAIYAMGKIGMKNPTIAIKHLLNHLNSINPLERMQELELILEAFGNMGAQSPSDELIGIVHKLLLGDTPVYAKDVAVKALHDIAIGLLVSQKSKKFAEEEDILNIINWMKRLWKMDYTIGDIIMILLTALQQKGMPLQIIEVIGENFQNLLPYLLFVEEKKQKFEHFDTLFRILAQAYYSNYSHEILRVMDRILSLMAFQLMFEIKEPIIKQRLSIYCKELTPNARLFYNQGKLIQSLPIPDKNKKIDYALKSYRFSLDLSTKELFSADCYYRKGLLYAEKKDILTAKKNLRIAERLYTQFDDIRGILKSKNAYEDLK